MKRMLFIVLCFCFVSGPCLAQYIPLASEAKRSRTNVYTSLGYEFGLVSKLGYGRLFNAKKPVFIGIDYSMPMGGQLSDDFMLRLGGQAQLFEKKSLLLGVQAYGSFKRHETAFVRAGSLGADLGVHLSYLVNRWTLTAQLMETFSVATQLKHSDLMKSNYPLVKDGWYQLTSGQFMYGGQVSRNLGRGFDLSFAMGVADARGRDSNALLPYYMQILFSKRF